MKTIKSLLLAQDKRWVGLLFALFAVVLLSAIMTVFYEIIVPRSQQVSGIEQSNIAYYKAESGIEGSMYLLTGAASALATGTLSSDQFTSSGFVLSECDGWSPNKCITPNANQGNSTLSGSWNMWSPGSPVQIRFDSSLSTIKTTIQMPSFSGTTNTNQLWGAYSGYIMTLNMSGVSITSKVASGIVFDSSGKYIFTTDFSTTTNGITNTGITTTFWSFLNNYTSRCTDYACTFKLSLLNPLRLNDSDKTPIPFVEYQLETNAAIPLQFAQIRSTGSLNGFTKNIERSVERFTTNEAFDFTVLQ